MQHDVQDLTTIRTCVLGCPTLLNGHNVVCGIASLLVARKEVLHAAIVLISEIIARVLRRGMIELAVVYGTASLVVVILVVLHVMTMLISEITARVLTWGMIELTVVFGTVNQLAVFQEVPSAVIANEIIAQAQAMERIIVFALSPPIVTRHIAGKVQIKYLVSTMSNLLQRFFK